MRRIPSTLTALTLLLALGCSGAPAPTADTAADETAIRAIDSNWNAWLIAHNDSAIAAIYSSDAIMMPPNMPRVTGAASIRSFWAGLWPIKADLVITPVSIRVSGNLAIEEGNWLMSIPTPAGADKDNGKYLESWRKDAGAWHVVQDMWSSDNPPPPAAAAAAAAAAKK
jgi:ketosteroid isomerase-like protein